MPGASSCRLARSHLRLVGFQSAEMLSITIFANEGFRFRHFDDILSLRRDNRGEREAKPNNNVQGRSANGEKRRNRKRRFAGYRRPNKQLPQYLSRVSRVFLHSDSFVTSCNIRWPLGHVLRHYSFNDDVVMFATRLCFPFPGDDSRPTLSVVGVR